MLVFRQLFDPTSSTYTYLLGCSASGEAVLIDPVFEQVRRDAALIGELGLKLQWTLETHVDADPETCLLYPAHDYRGLTATSVAEEKKFNPRLGGEVGEGDYVGYMKNLDLPHPKKIDEAVPANLRCGQPGNETQLPPDPSWAPLRFTFSGVWEVEPHWLEENLANVRVVDVREPTEFTGPLGHIRGATLVPLGELAQRAG